METCPGARMISFQDNTCYVYLHFRSVMVFVCAWAQRVNGTDGEHWTGVYRDGSDAPSVPEARAAFSRGFSVIINTMNFRWPNVIFILKSLYVFVLTHSHACG